MAKNNWILPVVVVGVLFFAMNGNMGNNGGANTNDGDVDLGPLLEPTAKFTGQRMFKAGTALSAEYVRVIRHGSFLDLGLISLNSGTVEVTPGAAYTLYYCENSTTRYTSKVAYTGPMQSGTDDQFGTCCNIDTTPTITLYDENGAVMASGSNEQTIGSGEKVTIEARVAVSAEECWGNPTMEDGNAVCFQFASGTYEYVRPGNMDAIAAPYRMASDKAAANALECYNMKTLKDNDRYTFPIEIQALSGQDPDDSHNITMHIIDFDYDLHADTLEEILDFQDETRNALGAAVIINGTIDIT